ncbi:hypothetical protein SAMN05421788_104442 [Filimonas lacunae]|uniref:Uncharacterized protein n=1 Tax=Filimonas lacunae TaxID=477680 RepID=A0A173MS54_9BACT|nr:hypothetical protein FLA_6248 [Filimonas lacunae]SIT18466.1 hypothetical protein SAMN05421788_104442 [Filimonas lacunae]
MDAGVSFANAIFYYTDIELLINDFEKKYHGLTGMDVFDCPFI